MTNFNVLNLMNPFSTIACELSSLFLSMMDFNALDPPDPLSVTTWNLSPSIFLPLCQQGLEYGDCTPSRIVRPLPPQKVGPVYDTKLYLIVRLLVKS